jgi:hypothetical protein|tara:strand:- start:101 stop:205 length:105 start_codon:yes stop_codon:yes gene_type:complete
MGEPKGGFAIGARLCTEFFGHNDSDKYGKSNEGG